MSAAVYARCTEPTGSNAREGCGWTGEVERVNEKCPRCKGTGCRWEAQQTALGPMKHVNCMGCCERCSGTGRVTHDGEGRWPFDINACPQCGGTIEVDK